MDQHEKHQLRVAAPEAALGEPNPDYADPFGPILVPYLSPSWREIAIVGHLHEMELPDQARAIYGLIQRRLPDLTPAEFEDLTGPEHFQAWWVAIRAPQKDGDSGPPSTGRGRSAPSPWSVLLPTGMTPHLTEFSMRSGPTPTRNSGSGNARSGRARLPGVRKRRRI
ncbi:hypothetical protein K7W42_17925 [Deinococcus sp. HMF7604]|uniref:hypothetical protein n=1 Tax=Deinococcus betulae TaxID=2873312 RepID=UPI001CCBCEE0|nr:hypothetical protein [Deinococcus betulae]MBZ9752723.1 hypothetical protein [Deinococcus betulae]